MRGSNGGGYAALSASQIREIDNGKTLESDTNHETGHGDSGSFLQTSTLGK